jgi:hypothetical protein
LRQAISNNTTAIIAADLSGSTNECQRMRWRHKYNDSVTSGGSGTSHNNKQARMGRTDEPMQQAQDQPQAHSTSTIAGTTHRVLVNATNNGCEQDK